LIQRWRIEGVLTKAVEDQARDLQWEEHLTLTYKGEEDSLIDMADGVRRDVAESAETTQRVPEAM
jgi:hypothetical protein